MPPILSNTNTFLTNSDNNCNTNSGQTNSSTQPILSNISNILYNTTLIKQQNSNITTPTLMNTSNTLTNTTITTQSTTPPISTPAVIEHKIWREGNTVYSKIVYADGSEDVKTLDLSDYYNEAYNEGVNSVDFSKTNHTIENGIIKVTTTLTNGKSQEYAITLDENLIVSLYNQIMAKKYEGVKIKQGTVEYSFLVKRWHPNVELNIAVGKTTDGSIVFEQLGNAMKSYTYTLIVDSIEKKEFLENTLPNSPVFDIDIGEGYKQALLTSIQLTPISPLLPSKYYADIEFIILE